MHKGWLIGLKLVSSITISWKRLTELEILTLVKVVNIQLKKCFVIQLGLEMWYCDKILIKRAISSNVAGKLNRRSHGLLCLCQVLCEGVPYIIYFLNWPRRWILILILLGIIKLKWPFLWLFSMYFWVLICFRVTNFNDSLFRRVN